MNENSKQYDLEERTAIFAEAVIEFSKNIKKDSLIFPLLAQFMRSATSIGANYCEANGASSKKDFLNKIYICKKEAKETKYWLRMIAKMLPNESDRCKKLLGEAQELTLIFSKIADTTKKS